MDWTYVVIFTHPHSQVHSDEELSRQNGMKHFAQAHMEEAVVEPTTLQIQDNYSTYPWPTVTP